MALEGQILLNELNCIYELAKKDETFAGKAVLICDFMNVLARPFWKTILNEAQTEFNDEFKDYFEKAKKVTRKIYDIRMRIINNLNDMGLSSLLDKKGLHQLDLSTKKGNIDVSTVCFQLSAVTKILDLLQKEYPKFVAQFINPKFTQKEKVEKYKFQIHVKDLEMEIDRYNKMLQVFIWSKIRRLVDFVFLYDPKRYNELEAMRQKRKMFFTKKSFELRHQAIERGVGANCVDLSLELNAMLRIIHFLARKVGASIALDNKRLLWSYRAGRFVANGEVKKFIVGKAPDEILKILTATPANRKKIWRYEELVDDDSLKSGKKINYHKQCTRINDDIYEATGVLNFLIYDTTSCYINPNHLD
jgi:hypothetical protein